MTFWLVVALGYLLLLGAGLAVGRWLGERFGGSDPSGGADRPAPAPADGPAFAVQLTAAGFLPLGSAFDRELLPEAFADEPAPARS